MELVVMAAVLGALIGGAAPFIVVLLFLIPVLSILGSILSLVGSILGGDGLPKEEE